MSRPSDIEDLEAYYMAGIGVAAAELEVPVQLLSVGSDSTAPRVFAIAPLRSWSEHVLRLDPRCMTAIEDYATVCLSGVAGRFLRIEARRTQVRRATGGAGLEFAQLRQVWEGQEPETERALVITLAYLANADEGDPEATTYRLWRRAVRLLCEKTARSQLDRLALQLLEVRQMTGDDVARFLSG